MSFYNGVLNYSATSATGQRGLPGIGFALDSNNNYDIQNKKLVNVGEGVDSGDAITKSQIQVLDNTPGNVQADKAVIYSDTGSIHTNSIYLQDTPDDAGNFNSTRLLTEQQSYDNIHLYVPDLQNFDGYGGRRRSEVMITSTDQNISGRKTFSDINVSKPNVAGQAANKKYVDDEIKKLPAYVRKDGSVVMTGDLNMGNKKILNVANPTTRGGAVNKKYVDDEIAKIPQSTYVRKDGSTTMTGNLDMGGKQIKSVADPTDDSDATTKKYFEDRLGQSHLVSSHKTNEFKYLKDSNESSSEYNITVKGITDFSGSPHQNKKAYSIVLTKDVGTNNYRSRIGFNLYSLAIGTYTIAFEFYPPEMTNVQLFCTASSAYIHKTVQRDFTDYSKLLVQFNNNSKQTPDYIYLTMHGTATTKVVGCHLVVYGVKDWSDSVQPGVYDGLDNVMFKYENGDMEMQTDLNMNSKRITHLSDPVDDGDAVNKLTLNSNLNSVSYYTKNHVYRSIFPEFYDLVETSHFSLINNVLGIVIDKIHPNLILEKDRFIDDYDPNNGLKLSRKTHIHTSKIFNSGMSYTFFMSFKHDVTKTCRISWSHTSPLPIKLYPRYEIAADQFRVDFGRIKGLSQPIQSVGFTSDFKNKQLCIWICYNAPRRLYKMALSNYTSHVNQAIPRAINSRSDQFEIDYDGFVNKIGFVDKFIDIDSLDFHRILLEEKRNGSYLE